ncbi:MAG TPA: hypothetical protein VHH93_03995, partial [Gammaproteobacteria bacterium]|nr:hypothetical protein [Gammaproteobacteria bacterium]
PAASGSQSALSAATLQTRLFLGPRDVFTGAVVKVPLFVEVGERIKVDTRTGEYIARAKE